MGRETRILLGLLGLLAGLFVGVLSLKLLVPRPPVGAGPDVHGDMAFTVRQELVPPPVRGPRAADFAAAPPLVAAPPAGDPFAAATPSLPDHTAGDPAAVIPAGPPASRFAVALSAADLEPLDAQVTTADPFVQPAAFGAAESPDREPDAGGSRFAGSARDEAGMAPEFAPGGQLDEPAAAPPVSRFGVGVETGPGDEGVSEREPLSATADPFPVARAAVPVTAAEIAAPPTATSRPADPFARPTVPAATAPEGRAPRSGGPLAGGHVVAAGDSWWSLAERAYGDGRLYRALYAWNRARDARVALVPGTSLEVPPIERLAASWPALMPGAR